MIEINLLREDRGSSQVEVVRESQRRRDPEGGTKVAVVDKVIALDKEWRTLRYKADNMNRSANTVTKTVKKKYQAKEKEGKKNDVPQFVKDRPDQLTAEELEKLDISQLKEISKFLKGAVVAAKEDVVAKEAELNRALTQIGNLVHQDVVVSNDEANNEVVREWGDRREEEGLLNHVDLMLKLGFMDTVKGAEVAGNRGYFLKGNGVLLKMALEQYAMTWLARGGYSPTYVPFFMTRSIMSEVAQLEQFDEELYKVTGEGEDKYLIATSEQPMAALHRGEWLEKELPLKYAGISTCFRKEAGSHGRDTLGIFRVHQFEKVEQFCYVSPKGDESWKMFDSMINESEEFYKSLNIPYKVVNIVSGELNNAAAMKYDLEAWFPASKTFRELVSCSNCTDYQARRLNIRYGTARSKDDESEKEFVHMLNSTLCALTRCICVILENYQTKEGVKVPPVLVPYMGGIDFLPFTK